MSILLAILLCFVVAAQTEDVAKPSELPPVVKSIELLPELKNGIESFTDKLTGFLYKRARPNSNVVISPLNIFAVFAELLFGADGETKEEIANFLGFPNTNETFEAAHKNFGDFLKSLEINKSAPCHFPESKNKTNCVYEDVSLANGIFLHKELSLVPSYSEKLQSHYNSSVESVDFANAPVAATDQINQWVSKKTRSLIPTLLQEPVDASVRIILAATIYFSAKWEGGIFYARRTKPLPFKTESSEVKVEYLFNDEGKKKVPYYEGSSFRALTLPYRGNDFETVIVLPNENITIGDFLESFSKDQVQKIFNESEPRSLKYRIPYIDIEWSENLKEPLKALNLTGVFNGVNLSKLISNAGSLFLSKVSHAAKLKVDEKGTVASGATAIEISLRSGRVRPDLTFYAERPYLMIIYHKQSKIPLFNALIRNPISA